jgi:transposase
MLYTNYTEDLLGLKDVIVTNVENVDGESHIFLNTRLQMQVCPNCRHETKRVHSYRMQPVKDLPLFGLRSILYLKKKRYFCPHCGKVFSERISFLPKYQRNTTRLYSHVLESFRGEYSTKSIAALHNISSSVAVRMLDRISYSRPKLPPVISIDEFKGNAGGQKFQCILADPKRRKVLDILPSRRSEDLYAYFLSFSRQERNNVKYIVMDMSLLFREVMLACFPNAQIITDKFHVCRHVTWSLESIRKQEQKKFSDERRKYFKKSRWLLLRKKDSLTEDNLLQLENMLAISPKLREGYWLKEKFYYFMQSNNLDEAKARLKEWNLCAGVANLEEFNKCFQTINRWQPYILRAFSLGYSNGYTEGTNNRIKVLKRNCYGVRNFERFRNRILHMMTA